MLMWWAKTESGTANINRDSHLFFKIGTVTYFPRFLFSVFLPAKGAGAGPRFFRPCSRRHRWPRAGRGWCADESWRGFYHLQVGSGIPASLGRRENPCSRSGPGRRFRPCRRHARPRSTKGNARPAARSWRGPGCVRYRPWPEPDAPHPGRRNKSGSAKDARCGRGAD